MPGRNEPCPCGSGLKYKRCCLPKDRDATDARIKAEQLEREAAAAALTAPRPSVASPTPKTIAPIKETDPHMAAIMERWNAFEKGGEEEQTTLFLKTLDEPELMDAEMAFGMLSTIYDTGVKSGSRDQVNELIGLLQKRLPKVYADDRKYYLQWQISNAFAAGRSEEMILLAGKIAETSGDDIECYHDTIHFLAYHGQLAALSQANRVAWPLINSSKNILGGGNAYSKWGADCVLFEELMRSQEIDGQNPLLIERIRYYYEDLPLFSFQEYVDRLCGRLNRTWSLSDFDFNYKKHRKAGKRRDASDVERAEEADAVISPAREALSDLTLEFIPYAHSQEGIPYTKAELARQNIESYLLQRLAGYLDSSQNTFDRFKSPQPKQKLRVPEHVLAPDRVTLDRYLADLLNMFKVQRYAAAATLELVPVWLRFLETRGLIERSQRESTVKELSHLHNDLLPLFEADLSDPALTENLRRWPEIAARQVALPEQPTMPSQY